MAQCVAKFERSGRRRSLPTDRHGRFGQDSTGAETDRYSFVSQARYLEAFINEVVGTSRVTLVLARWGGDLGFDWPFATWTCTRHCLLETFVTPLTE